MYQEARKPMGMLDLDWQSPEARDEAVRLQTEAREIGVHEPFAEVIEDWLNKPVSAAAAAAGDEMVARAVRVLISALNAKGPRHSEAVGRFQTYESRKSIAQIAL